MIHLGVDTLSYHLRLERGEISVEEVFAEAATLGCECVQLTLHHVRGREVAELDSLYDLAKSLGLSLLASGDTLGRAREGDDREVAVTRVQSWLERAVALRSPILRVVSGFYRAHLADRPELIELERRYVIDALDALAPLALSHGVTLLLENHSDFTAEEYRGIIDEVGADRVGVFIDLVNPISAFENPEPVVSLLAPYALAGHAKDYRLRSELTDDGYHRRGFDVRWCYPGEGAADLPALITVLRAGIRSGDFYLTIEGLDSVAGRADQKERIAASLELLRGLTAR